MSAANVRPDLAARLRAAEPFPIGCKVCSNAAPLFGVVDFNKCCEEVRAPPLRMSGVPIYYRRCGACGLVFTDAFDDWAQADFETHIYNSGYVEVDPDYVKERPDSFADLMKRVYGHMAADLRILDYGGGNGRFAETLRAAGFQCETYDPFTPAFQARPTGHFDIITCVETLEHLPQPVAGVADIVSFLKKPGGLILFTTLLQDQVFDQQGVGWWYIGPRNGHVTIFSASALGQLWAEVAMNAGSLSENVHLAFRGDPPGLAAPLLTAPGA